VSTAVANLDIHQAGNSYCSLLNWKVWTYIIIRIPPTQLIGTSLLHTKSQNIQLHTQRKVYLGVYTSSSSVFQ